MKKYLLIPLIPILSLSSITSAQVLFYDDFEGSSLDPTVWSVKSRPVSGPLGRTQTGLSPTLTNGVAQLKLDTYNPNAPGALFSGTEILTRTKYSLNTPGVQGLRFETSMSVKTPLANGLVVGFFTFGRDGLTSSGDDGVGGFDEIDIEILSNLVNNPEAQDSEQEILLNVFAGQINNDVPLELGPQIVDISTIDLSDFNTYAIHWFADKIEWFINDQKLFTLTDAALATADASLAADLANSEQGLHFNLWAPNSNFERAFDSGLVPTSNPELNESFFVDIDYVEITAIPEPNAYALCLAGMVGLGIFLMRKQLF